MEVAMYLFSCSSVLAVYSASSWSRFAFFLWMRSSIAASLLSSFCQAPMDGDSFFFLSALDILVFSLI